MEEQAEQKPTTENGSNGEGLHVCGELNTNEAEETKNEYLKMPKELMKTPANDQQRYGEVKATQLSTELALVEIGIFGIAQAFVLSYLSTTSTA